MGGIDLRQDRPGEEDRSYKVDFPSGSDSNHRQPAEAIQKGAAMEEAYRGVEKRRHPRTKFYVEERPRLRIGVQEFEIIDISEKGVRFVNDKKVGSQGWVNGTIVFPDARSIDIDGIVVRRESGNMGLHLISPIDVELSSS